MHHWQTKRAFAWGLFLVMDRDATSVPDLDAAVVSQSGEGVAIKVLHAQDVDLSPFGPDEVVPLAEVQVDIQIGGSMSVNALFRGTIDVPSGVLTIGDADWEDQIEIGAGRWVIEVACDPVDHAERVRVHLNRA